MPALTIVCYIWYSQVISDQYIFVLLLDLRPEVFDAGRSDFVPAMIDCRDYGFG